MARLAGIAPLGVIAALDVDRARSQCEPHPPLSDHRTRPESGNVHRYSLSSSGPAGTAGDRGKELAKAVLSREIESVFVPPGDNVVHGVATDRAHSEERNLLGRIGGLSYVRQDVTRTSSEEGLI